MAQAVVTTKTGNWTHVSNDGAKTACGKAVDAETTLAYGVSCHRCDRYVRHALRVEIDKAVAARLAAQ